MFFIHHNVNLTHLIQFFMKVYYTNYWNIKLAVHFSKCCLSTTFNELPYILHNNAVAPISLQDGHKMAFSRVLYVFDLLLTSLHSAESFNRLRNNARISYSTKSKRKWSFFQTKEENQQQTNINSKFLASDEQIKPISVCLWEISDHKEKLKEKKKTRRSIFPHHLILNSYGC